MRRLIPTPKTPSDLDDIALVATYTYPGEAAAHPWVRANMVSSADGAAQLDGLSQGLSGPSDQRIFHLLRALADVVLVGQTTVLRETYVPIRPRAEFAGLRAANGQDPAPAIAIVCDDPTQLDLTAPLFTAERARTVVITTRRAAAEPAWATAAGALDAVIASAPGHDDRVDLPSAVIALAERGWTRVLCEGGPTLLAQLAAVGLLDELCLSVSPRLTAGPGKRITHGPTLKPPLPLELVGLLEEDGFLFTRYRRG
jgi:riboflavin biosynthesis pyrimidine reductase